MLSIANLEIHPAGEADTRLRSALRKTIRMISVSNVTMRYGSKVLFEDVSR